MNTKDTLHGWRQLLTGQRSQHDISSQLLDRCGMWGCLLGAVLASKIAQYLLVLDNLLNAPFAVQPITQPKSHCKQDMSTYTVTCMKYFSFHKNWTWWKTNLFQPTN